MIIITRIQILGLFNENLLIVKIEICNLCLRSRNRKAIFSIKNSGNIIIFSELEAFIF